MTPVAQSITAEHRRRCWVKILVVPVLAQVRMCMADRLSKGLTLLNY